MKLKQKNAQTLMSHFKGDFQIEEFTKRINETIRSLKGLLQNVNHAKDLPPDGVFEAISGQALYIRELGKQLRSMEEIKKIAETKQGDQN